jgi:murein DD-endopeptidase MepM/ murein hydrolase activator NlpD
VLASRAADTVDMRTATPAALAAAVLGLLSPTAAVASTGGTEAGGTTVAVAVARTGGVQYDATQAAAAARPLLTQLSVPQSISAGSLPRVRFRVDERGVGTVAVRVNLIDVSTGRTTVSAALGWVHTGRLNTVRWPAGAALAAGSYRVSVVGHDHHGAQLAGTARGATAAGLTVTAPPPASAPPAPETAEPGVPTPGQTAADGAIFPVAGPHNFGGPENRFGAPRAGHVHQGQDILTEEGTPIVAPFAGTITQATYQAEAAGYYAVEHTGVGFDFMFAHCRAGSLAVSRGEQVSAGQQLCAAGQTGDATAPHLHFEMWVGGWWAPGGHPIDPLPYLEAWERASASR